MQNSNISIKIDMDTSSLEEAINNAVTIVKSAMDEINDTIISLNGNGSELGNVFDDVNNVLGILSSTVAIAAIAVEKFSTSSSLLSSAMAFLMNPTILTVAAVTALTAAFAGIVYGAFNSKSELDKLTETAKKATDEHLKLRDANDLVAESNVKQFDYYSKLKNELDKIIDANGKVKEGYEERALFITSELSKATGEEININEGIIDNYKEISTSIDDIIAKKRAKAILDAHESDYNDALKKQRDALNDMKKAEKALAEERKKKDAFLDEYVKNNIRYGKSEEDMLKDANSAWSDHIKDYKDNLKAQEDRYEEYTRSIRNYEQANQDFLAGNYDKINDTIAGTNDKYAANAKERKEIINANLEDEIAQLNYLNKHKADLSEEQYAKEKEMRETTILEEQEKIFAMCNAAWEGSEQYKEAMAYLSEEGMKAYDKNGDLTQAARTKIELLHLETLALTPEYSEALMSLANSGQAVFDENGELTSAAQTKLVNAFTKVNELDPLYSDALSAMAKKGQSVFNVNGELTDAAQKKMIDVYTKMNELSPEYKNTLLEMVKNGETVFDKNGNLTDAAKKKVSDAKKAVKDSKKTYTDENSSLSDQGVRAFGTADYFGTGSSFIMGAANGMYANIGHLTTAAGAVAQGAISAFKNNWQINSPSKRTRKLAGSFMEGLQLGVEDNKQAFFNTIDNISEQTIKKMGDALHDMSKQKLRFLSEIMESAVIKNDIQIQKGIRIIADYESGKAIHAMNKEKSILKGKLDAVIENKVLLNDRELAVALAPLISEELAFQ